MLQSCAELPSCPHHFSSFPLGSDTVHSARALPGMSLLQPAFLACLQVFTAHYGALACLQRWWRAAVDKDKTSSREFCDVAGGHLLSAL